MDKLASLLKTIGAPILATVVGGPFGGLASAAVGALADALGTEPTPEAVAARLDKASIEEVGPIVRTVEATKGTEYLDALRLEIEDRKSARDMHIVEVQTGGWAANMPAVLAITVTALFAATLGVLMFRGVPDSQIAFLMVGAVISEFRGSLAFFFGTTAGSIRSGDTVRNIAQQAATPTAGQVAGKAIDAAIKVARK